MAFPIRTRTNLAAARMLICIALALSIAGCQTMGEGGLPVSKATPDLSTEASQIIAADMTARLTEIAEPGSARSVSLKGDDTPFAAALETSLTQAGYTIANNREEYAGAMQLAYVVEEFEGNALARLSTQSVDLGRVYSITATGAAPASPVSIKRKGS
jgi:ABC-type Fe3+-hydroxamate transport system substrate-binding protein